ncbi:30ee4856-21f0-4bbc-ae13-56e843df2887 [Thermothielavioides terrestris]|uniref:30ee4856-21f0-4bbc-ae13-56e843df2887 n=1 Tax=Thermothielavioides terrestris TaxID=2587410 RepID=A0A3S4BRK9_9PEZI|nr:30ee4856-21f0-4bbc-ae13-56e843df2887 [Thermothielavioides terrestris]
MRGTGSSSSPRGLTLPMRYLMRKRLKYPAPLEVTERRQVGDAEATVNPVPSPPAHDRRSSHYPPRGSDSEL